MSGDAGDKVLDLNKTLGLEELMRRTATSRAAPVETPKEAVPEESEGALPSFEKLAPLPMPGDAYKAYSRPSHQMLPTLYLMLADGSKRGFPYSGRIEGPHLVPDDDPGKGNVIVIRFSASKMIEVQIRGRHLDELHHYLGDHRMRWVRELPKGKFVNEAGAAVVTSIGIGVIEEEPQRKSSG